tara:strand:- start:6805 stop:8517 length:1713 start_codon:yes stop_codon:yes gene_type:complete
MAKTGYKIIETVVQSFNNGQPSGSVASGSTNSVVTLSTSSLSASLDEETYFNRSFSPIDCVEDINECKPPVLTGIYTGSQRGYFNLNYTTQDSNNSPTKISASISQTNDFSSFELFSASIGSLVPITSSYVSGTVFFRAFTSCSGISPDRSLNSDLLSFTYDEISPEEIKGDVNIQFLNNLSSPMEVQIRSQRGNSNHKIAALNTFNYTYSNSNLTGSWNSVGKSSDVSVTIKGGSKNTFGNFIQRRTIGLETLTYTTGSGFDNPLLNVDSSDTFPPDTGINFTIRQLDFPPTGESTTTTFSLLQVSSTSTDSSGIMDGTITPTIRFGSTPLISQNAACSDSKVNSTEITYFQLGSYLYNNREDAESKTRPIFPFNTNYILITPNTYLIVNKDGFIQNLETCILPSLNIFTQDGSFNTQEEACKRVKSSGEVIFYKDNQLRGDGRNLSGRFPINNDSQGGTNVILSAGNIVGFETCGTELETSQLSIYGYPSSSYPFDTPELINPETLAVACGDDTFITYYQGGDGTIYHDFDGPLAYNTVGDGGYYYKNESDEFLLLSDGLILSSSTPC